MIICKCSSPCSFQAKTSRELTSASSPLLSSTQNTQHSLLHKYQSYWKAAPCTTQWREKKTTLIERSGRAAIAWVTGGHKTSLKLSFQDFLLLLSSFQLVSETCVFSPSRSKYAELAANRSQKRCTHTAPWGTTAVALRLFCSQLTAFFLAVPYCSSHTPGYQVLSRTPAQHSCSLWSLNPFS